MDSRVEVSDRRLQHVCFYQQLIARSVGTTAALTLGHSGGQRTPVVGVFQRLSTLFSLPDKMLNL